MLSRLERLTEQRDFIEGQLGSAKDYIELEVRGGRRVKRRDAVDHLNYLNGQIKDLENKAAVKRGPARNRARLHRS